MRQGGPESPILFNLYVDFVMRAFIEKCHTVNEIKFCEHKYRIHCRSLSRDERSKMRLQNTKYSGCSTLPWCGYADDLVLFLQSRESLLQAAELLDQMFKEFGLSINNSKTETMILNTDEYIESIISLRGKNLNNVSVFKYLGAFINSNQPNTGESEINHRIQLAQVKFAEMSNLLQNFQIQLKTRIMFLNCYVRSRLTYASQNWSLTGTQFDRLDTTYRSFLRRMIRHGFQHFDRDSNDFRLVISNAELHRICGTKDVGSFIRLQQKKYASHVIRMPQERTTKRLMFNDDRCTKRGRSAKTLLEQVICSENVSVDQFCNLSIGRRF